MPYDRKFPVGKLDKVLDEAASISWTVVSMKEDWTAIFSRCTLVARRFHHSESSAIRK